MATGVETMWVADEAQLQATVETLVAQGGQLQARAPDEAQVHVEKKLNGAVLVGGLVAGLVPGLVYLAWHKLADQSRLVTVRVGAPSTIRTEHRLWPDDEDRAPTPPPEREPTVFGPNGRVDRGADPPAYPSDPERFPTVESPPPPPEPPAR
jgi:hypothetical protein